MVLVYFHRVFRNNISCNLQYVATGFIGLDFLLPFVSNHTSDQFFGFFLFMCFRYFFFIHGVILMCHKFQFASQKYFDFLQKNCKALLEYVTLFLNKNY